MDFVVVMVRPVSDRMDLWTATCEAVVAFCYHMPEACGKEGIDALLSSYHHLFGETRTKVLPTEPESLARILLQRGE